MDPFFDFFVILFIAVIPVVFLLLQAFLSSRKRVRFSVIIPIIWTLLGAWIIIVRFVKDDILSSPLCIYFIGGDIILIGITILMRYLKSRRKK